MKFNPNGKIAMYANSLMEWMAGSGIDASTRLSEVSIKTMYDRFMTKNIVSQTWCVHMLPTFYNEPFVKKLREYLFTKFKDTEVIVHTHNVPVTNELNVGSDSFKAQMSQAESLYVARQNILDDGSATEQAMGKTIRGYGMKFMIRPKDVEKARARFESYHYVYDRATSGGEVFQTFLLITANFKKKDRTYMAQFEKALRDFMIQNGKEISYYMVAGNLKSCLTNFGVTSSIDATATGQFPSLLMTDENLSTFTPFADRGLQGGTGYLLGIDKKTNLPFILHLTGSGNSQVILCVGQPGSGKTYTCGDGFVFGGLANNHYVSIFDIKSGEYDNLLPFADSVLIDFSAKSGKYVNTLRIDDVPLPKKSTDAKEIYLSAINSTIGWLSTIVNLQDGEGNVRDLEGFLRKSLEFFFMSVGVIADNPLTYYKSKVMDVHDIPKYMAAVINDAPEGSTTKAIGRIAHERCSVYLSSESPSGNIFQEEVTLAEVLRKNLVIYSFGLNSGAYMEASEGIKSHMANAIDTKKEYYLKQEDKFLTVLYEELNSCKYIPYFIRNVSARVVRSRSNNVNIVMLMNSLQVLMEKDFQDIASNIRTLVAGALNPIDFPLLDKLNASVIRGDVEKISSGEYDSLTNCFAIKFNTGAATGNTVIKAYYPPDVSELLRTRSVEDEFIVSG